MFEREIRRRFMFSVLFLHSSCRVHFLHMFVSRGHWLENYYCTNDIRWLTFKRRAELLRLERRIAIGIAKHEFQIYKH